MVILDLMITVKSIGHGSNSKPPKDVSPIFREAVFNDDENR
jgi:hypothetical protein